MITKEQIQECKLHCSNEGYVVTEEDIAYLLLNREFRDKVLAYKITKGDVLDATQIDTFDNCLKMQCLRKYMNEHWRTQTSTVKSDMTFEENRDSLVQMISDIEQKMQEGAIEEKDGMKMIADIRIKLNDKFNMKEQQVEQRIIVQPKFNYICNHTHKECWLMTEEWAMKQYHLIKDPNYHEEVN